MGPGFLAVVIPMVSNGPSVTGIIFGRWSSMGPGFLAVIVPIASNGPSVTGIIFGR